MGEEFGKPENLEGLFSPKAMEEILKWRKSI